MYTLDLSGTLTLWIMCICIIIMYMHCMCRYIKGLESDSQYMSTLKSSREIRQSHQLAPSRVRPTDWIDAQALKDKKDSASLVDALWALRDQLLQDSLNIDGSGLDK